MSAWGGGVSAWGGGVSAQGGCLPGGCLSRGGVCPGGCLPGGGCLPDPPVNRITDRCKNYLATTTLRTVNFYLCILFVITGAISLPVYIRNIYM